MKKLINKILPGKKENDKVTTKDIIFFILTLFIFLSAIIGLLSIVYLVGFALWIGFTKGNILLILAGMVSGGILIIGFWDTYRRS